MYARVKKLTVKFPDTLQAAHALYGALLARAREQIRAFCLIKNIAGTLCRSVTIVPKGCFNLPNRGPSCWETVYTQQGASNIR